MQADLRKDACYVTFLIRLKNILWKYLWLFKNIPQKLFPADKIDKRQLKIVQKWNVVFWEQCIAINQSFTRISGLMSACFLSQYGQQIIWQFLHVKNCKISVAGVFLPLVIFPNEKAFYNPLSLPEIQKSCQKFR